MPRALRRHFERKGEHRKAKAVVVITTALWAAATIWNVKQITRESVQDGSPAAYRTPAPQLQVTLSW